MTPVLFVFVGLILVWAVFTGRATALWDAITKGTA